MADFGLARSVAMLAGSQGGTLQYDAPEVLTSSMQPDERSDLHSPGPCCEQFDTR